MLLLMDSKISNLYQNIKNLMEETAVELQTDLEGLTEILADFDLSVMDSENIILTADEIPEMDETNQEVLNDGKEPLPVTSKNTEEVKPAEDATVLSEQSGEKITAEGMESEETAQEENTQEESVKENGSQNADRLFKESADRNESKNPSSFPAYQNLSDKVSFFEQAQPAEGNYRMADLESIYHQVIETVKVRMSPDTTSLELSLNPQNLGKVSVEVASKEGTVSAQFRVQDAMAKAALESQVVELKNTLNEQGIKVEAIEVTVASHEFERNLEENQKDQQKLEDAAREMNERAAGNRRNLHLGIEEGIPDDMTEAEELMAKMMSENGNRMSLFA